MEVKDLRQRALGDDFFKQWVGDGRLRVLSDAAMEIPGLILCLRGDENHVSIYYRGINILDIYDITKSRRKDKEFVARTKYVRYLDGLGFIALDKGDTDTIITFNEPLVTRDYNKYLAICQKWKNADRTYRGAKNKREGNKKDAPNDEEFKEIEKAYKEAGAQYAIARQVIENCKKLLLMLVAGVGHSDSARPDKDGCEKEVQQQLVMENNFIGDAGNTDYFIVDIEYNMKRMWMDGDEVVYSTRNKNHDRPDIFGRADAVAVRWPRNSNVPNGIAFIEVKAGTGVVGWQKPSPEAKNQTGNLATISNHFYDAARYIRFLNDNKRASEVYEDIEKMLYQLHEMGWIKTRDKTVVKQWYKVREGKDWIAGWGAPQMIYVLGNYDLTSDALHNEVYGNADMAVAGKLWLTKPGVWDFANDKNGAPIVDMRFAVASFMGYGLYNDAEHMMGLDGFIKRYNIAKEGGENGGH